MANRWAGFVVVMHLSLERPSHLPEILMRHTGSELDYATGGLHHLQKQKEEITA